ncbi:MAG: TIGR03936 family radical SAM-associated protein [Candidatus Zixiibacteriota bacterium]
MPGPAFFYHVLKPGRYLGGEGGIPGSSSAVHGPTVVWFHPDRYEIAMSDPGWRRGYFQLVGRSDVRCARAVGYAADVWQQLAQRGLPPFAIDGAVNLCEVDWIVFWVNDPLRAALIPGIIRKLGLGDSHRPRIGVVVDGHWSPRFLLGHVDWVIPAPGGWLPRSSLDLLSGATADPAVSCNGRDADDWAQFWSGRRSDPPLMGGPFAATPRWVTRIEIGDDFADVDLAMPNGGGVLGPRTAAAVTRDALDGLKATGIDGVRFCGAGWDHGEAVAAALTEMGRRFNMKRVRAHWPALTLPSFAAHWSSYKPHLLKPILRLRMAADADVGLFIDVGRRALNDGWQGLTLVLPFASFRELSSLFPVVRPIIEGWHAATEGFSDKRSLRLEYRPAPVDRWQDPPSAPDEDDLRRFLGEFRHFKDDLSKWAAVGTYRLEDLIAGLWLAASDHDLWPRLERLELSDRNTEDALPFDWLSWVRLDSGMSAAPDVPFCRKAPVWSDDSQPPAPTVRDEGSESLLAGPGEELFGRRKRKAAFTRRLTAPSLVRMRVRWARDASWRFYSHLDLVRAIERAIRRAGLPAAYSEGFHPRLKLSFGPPLAFGLTSEAEYFDLVLEEDYEPELAERLGRCLPDGVTIKEARGFAAGVPALSDLINEAVYQAIIPVEIAAAERRIQEFGAQKEIRWRRPDRLDRKPIDPRKNLLGTSVQSTERGTRWDLDLRLGGEGNLRPGDWATLLFGLTSDQLAETVIARTALLIRQGGVVRSPFESI